MRDGIARAGAGPGRGARSARRRTAVLDAALSCFTGRGFTETSIGDIRAVSGASTGSLYHHFGDKSGIAVALYVDVLERYQSSALEALHRAGGAESGVRAGVHHHLEWIRDHLRESTFVIDGPPAEVAREAAGALRPVNEHFFEALRAWLDGHAAQDRLRSLPLGVAYAVWIGPSQEYARLWLRSRRSHRALAVARRSLADAAWRALAPDR